MAITISSSNISSLQAQKSLSDATSKVAKAYQQLSSGLRINQAGDDAAGLAIATQLNSKARVYNVGVRNVNDAINASTIAEGALNSLKEISQRQLELTEQAANGTYSKEQRSALNTEANALVDEYNRIVSSTTFNGLSLFDPKLGSVLIQAGSSTLTEAFSSGLSRAVGDGTFQSAVSVNTSAGSEYAVLTVDLNGDGKADLLSTGGSQIVTLLGNGNGTFQSQKSSALQGMGAIGIVSADLNGDGRNDVVTTDIDGLVNVLLGNGNGTFSAAKTLQTFAGLFGGGEPIALGDIDGDGTQDIVTIDGYNDTNIFFGNGDGTFRSPSSASTGDISPSSVTLGDVNGDGKLDIISSDAYSNAIRVLLNNGNGTFQAPTSLVAGGNTTYYVLTGDLNGDGNLDVATADYISGDVSVLNGNGDGTCKAAKTYQLGGRSSTISLGDFNGDGRNDIVSGNYSAGDVTILINNGDGTFKAAKTFVTGNGPNSVAVGDFNGDGRADIVTGDSFNGDVSVLTGNGNSTSSSKYLNLNSRAYALDSQATVNGNLDRIESQLGSLGATGSRFQTALNNLQVQSQNFEAAASRIQDADIAQESSVLVRTQILQQAAASVLAQANQQPSLALKLIQ